MPCYLHRLAYTDSHLYTYVFITYSSVFTPPSSMFIVRVHMCIIHTCIQIDGITVVTTLRMLFALGLNYIESERIPQQAD